MRFELLPPVPAVSLVRRLKQIPLFRFASMDELFRISSIARQVRYQESATVQERGAPPEYIQVLLHGRFRVENGNPERAILSPPALLGFQEVLKGTTLQDGARAETESVALVMPAEDFRTLLAANIELAQGLFRMLLEPTENGRFRSLAELAASFRYQPRPEPLKTVEKVMYLQTIPVFSHATAEEIYAVAAITREVPLEEGSTLFSAGSPASIILPLSGTVEVSSPGGETRALTAGDCVGVHETLAGASWTENARVLQSGNALQIEKEPLFDLLADRMDLLQGIFSAVFHRRGGARVGSP